VNKHKLLHGFIVVIIGALLGTIFLFLMSERPLPAEAQAQELFELYFDMNQVRQDSAQIFAELIEVDTNPERVGVKESIGSEPPLSSQDELIDRLKENQTSVEQNLDTIEANKFTDPEVKRRYDEMYTFYTTLFEFENMFLAELSLAENNEEQYAHLTTTLFEGGDWPSLLAEDAKLLDELVSLAELHDLEFIPLSYENIFRERLIELRRPIISDKVNTIVYPFTVDETAVNQVSLTIGFNIEVTDKIIISLEDPGGRIISSDQLAEYSQSAQMNHLSFISRDNHTIGIKLFPDDPLVMPIMGNWKIYVTAPVGSKLVIGMTQG